MNLGKILKGLGHKVAVQKLGWWQSIRLWRIFRKLCETLLTVEKMMQDGKIDATERKELATKVIVDVLDELGINLPLNDVSAFIDLAVSLFNNLGIFKKKG